MTTLAEIKRKELAKLKKYDFGAENLSIKRVARNTYEMNTLDESGYDYTNKFKIVNGKRVAVKTSSWRW